MRKWKALGTMQSSTENLFSSSSEIYFQYLRVTFVKPSRCNNHLNTMTCKNFGHLRGIECLSNFRGKKNSKYASYIKVTVLRVYIFQHTSAKSYDVSLMDYCASDLLKRVLSSWKPITIHGFWKGVEEK